MPEKYGIPHASDLQQIFNFKPDKNPEMWKSILHVIHYRTEAAHEKRKQHVSLKSWFKQGIMVVILITGVLAIVEVDFAGPNPPYYAQRFPVIIELVRSQAGCPSCKRNSGLYYTLGALVLALRKE